MKDMTINIDLNTLKKYWLSISATAAGLWYSLNPTAQANIIHYVGATIKGYPKLSAALGTLMVILADLKQSPLTPSTSASPAAPAAK
jgi:hypothetical protein